ncbi:T9SS type A sorting domain-containing protein [Bacteroidota bacterium]
MKKNYLLIHSLLMIFVSIILISAIGIVDFYSMSERQQYELYLVSEYSNIPELGMDDIESLPKPDRPDLAALQNYYMTIDPDLKRVPTERLHEAYLDMQQIKSESNLNGNRSQIYWDETGSNMGGRTRALMYDPNYVGDDRVFAGSVTGGLWVNENIVDPDQEWTPIDDFWANLSVSCIVYDPNDTEIFYVGTGEAQTAITIYRESSGVGMGIMKSTDGGESWNHLPSTIDFKYVTDIAVRDENGISVIYAGVVSGDYHGIHQSLPTDGLYRSADGGTTWEQVLPNIDGLTIPYAVSDIEITADNRIFVGTMQNINQDGGSVIFSSDSGLPGSWGKYDDIQQLILGQSYYKIPGRVVLASAPSDANRVYALFAVGYDDGFTYYMSRYIIRTDDAGQNWNNINLPDQDYATLAWHALMASVDPNDPDHIYVGGLDVWKSENGGTSWNHVSDWSLMYWGGGSEYVHADQHISVFKPGSSDEIIFGSDGGVFYTDDGTSNSPDFEQMNQSYNSLQFYTCAIHPVAGENKYIGGLQDNGTLYYNDSPLDINDMVDGGDGALCFYDKDEPQLFITSIYYNRYSIFINGGPANEVGTYSGTFVSPADYDYKENTIYANACHFFGSWADNILKCSGIPWGTQEAFVPINTGSFVPFSAVKYSEFSPAGKATLFVASQSGGLWKVEEAQGNPVTTEITGSNFPLGSISCIAMGGSDDTLLVTFSNYGVTSLWQTYDGGINWEPKQGNLPDMPVRWAIHHPTSAKQALIATEIGVWFTNTLHHTDPYWEPASDGMANVRVDMLQLREADNTVLAASHGRGLFTCTFNSNPYVGIKENELSNLEVFPNPTSGMFKLRFDNPERTKLQLKVIDISGKLLIDKELEQQSTSVSENIDLTAFTKGTYILKLTGDNIHITEKIIIQ